MKKISINIIWAIYSAAYQKNKKKFFYSFQCQIMVRNGWMYGEAYCTQIFSRKKIQRGYGRVGMDECWGSGTLGIFHTHIDICVVSSDTESTVKSTMENWNINLFLLFPHSFCHFTFHNIFLLVERQTHTHGPYCI